MPPLTTKCTTESRCPPQYQTRPVQQYRNTEVGTVQQYQPGEVGTVQQYHSFFIKEGLRMKVKQNLKDEDNGQDALETELKTENDEVSAFMYTTQTNTEDLFDCHLTATCSI